MKKLVIFAVALVMVFSVGSAFAANALKSGSMGVSVGMGDSIFGKTLPPDTVVNPVVNISGRYFASNDLAITGGFGLQTDGGDADGTYLSFSAGVRKYLKTSDFAPFVGGKFTFATVEDDVADFDADLFDLEASFGAEYFFSEQFSMEGAVGIGFGQLSSDDFDDTYFGTRTIGVFANLYF